jgi:hypothetical protein
MNENQARRKEQDLKASMRDFRFDGNPNRDYNPIEEAAMQVNAARMEEERDIGKSGEIDNEVWR